MSDGEINNGYMDEEFGINMPAPQQAWQDMLTRLDDDMPVTAVPLPGSIIQVDNGLMRGITSLLGLLFITSAAWLFTGKGIIVKSDKPGNTIADKTIQAVKQDEQDRKAAAEKNKTPLAGGEDTTANNSSNTNTLLYTPNKQLSNSRRAKITSGIGTIENKTLIDNTFQNDAALQPAANLPPSAPKPAADTTAIAVAKPATSTKAPLSGTPNNNNDEHKDGDEKKDSGIIWQAGIWVKAQLPFSSAQHYFAGPNTSSQPWRILLPGVWISAQTGKHLFEAEINPFASIVYNPKPFAVNTVLVNGQAPATETKRLNKMFGISLSAGYSYNIGGAWWLGGRLQSTLLTKGVGNITVADGNTVYSNRFTVIKNSDTTSFQKFQVRLDAEAMYKAKRWAAGARAGVYFSPSPIKYSNAKNPLETEIFFRWQLWRKR